MRATLSHASVTLLLAIFAFNTEWVGANEVEKNTIVLATGNWEPYYGERLPDGGIVSEIVREAFMRVGYRLQIKWVPWARALRLARGGDFDGVLGAWYTEERTEHFAFSKPFFKNEIVFFKRKGDAISYTTFEDLKPLRIGVTIDSGPYELLKNELSQNLDIVPNPGNNIKKLMRKRFDLLADEKLGVLYIINTRFPEWRGAIESIEPPLQINYLHIMISKQVSRYKEIVKAFNVGLREIIEDGTFNSLYQKHGFGSDTNEEIKFNEHVKIPVRQ